MAKKDRLRTGAGFGVLLLFVLGTVGGCGRGAQLTTLQGVVKFKGKPIDRMQVLFLPDPDQKTKGPRSTGVTDREGKFQLKSDDGAIGVVVGHHRVVIRDLNMYGEVKLERLGRLSEAEAAKLPPPRIPMVYSDSFRTPLRVEIKSAQNQIELVINPKAGD